jgi:hypothetical protein
MPKLRRTISDDMLQGGGVYDLDQSTPIISAQAGLLLGRSKTRLDSDRRDGKPPPYYKDGTKVLYRLGDVLDARKAIQGQAITTHQRGLPPRNFAGFMSTARLKDEWPMVLGERPLDFFSAIGTNTGKAPIKWMTLEAILKETLLGAQKHEAAMVKAALMDVIGKPNDRPKRKPGVF